MKIVIQLNIDKTLPWFRRILKTVKDDGGTMLRSIPKVLESTILHFFMSTFVAKNNEFTWANIPDKIYTYIFTYICFLYVCVTIVSPKKWAHFGVNLRTHFPFFNQYMAESLAQTKTINIQETMSTNCLIKCHRENLNTKNINPKQNHEEQIHSHNLTEKIPQR